MFCIQPWSAVEYLLKEKRQRVDLHTKRRPIPALICSGVLTAIYTAPTCDVVHFCLPRVLFFLRNTFFLKKTCNVCMILSRFQKQGVIASARTFIMSQKKPDPYISLRTSMINY